MSSLLGVVTEETGQSHRAEPAGWAERMWRLLNQRDVILLTAFVLLSTAGQLLRQRGVPSWDTVWAEDGALYMKDAQDRSILGGLFTPYRSYLAVSCRLLALPTRWLPLSVDAKYLAVSAALTTSMLAVFVYCAAGTVVKSRWLRLVLAAAMVWGPTMLFESTANVANVIWPMLFAGFWAVIARGRGRLLTLSRTAVALLAVLTNALALAFLPLAAVLAYRRRDRGDRWVTIALGFGALTQIIVALTSAATSREGTNAVKDVAELFPGRVLSQLFVGNHLAEHLWLQFGMWWASACLIAVLAVGFWLARFCRNESRWLAASAVLYSLVLFGAPIWLRGSSIMRLTRDNFNLAGTRFDTVPALLLISAAILALGDVRRSRDRTLRRVTSIALGIQILIVVAVSFSGRNPRSDGPRWSAELASAKKTCETTKARDVNVKQTPYPSWTVTVRCNRVLR